MRLKGAMTVLNKRAEFYGVTFDKLIEWYDSDGPMQISNEILSVIRAYEIYKRDGQGLYWSGLLGYKWVTWEQGRAINQAYKVGGHQLDLFKESII
tara:strand:- start:911 stop:1198 length:288 start_codon:yes stop_codon:yes gene_type:complete